MSSKRLTGGKYNSSMLDIEQDVNDANRRRSCRDIANRKQYHEMDLDDNYIPEQRKKIRGPSKRPCVNRNALLARENRQRKKEYIAKMENKLLFYQQENKDLTNIIQKQGINIKRLTDEVTYLKSVLNNNTTITALLSSINDGLRKRNVCLPNDSKVQGINIAESVSEGKEIDSKRKFGTDNFLASTCCDAVSVKDENYRLPIIRKTVHSFPENDHTYTVPKEFSLNNLNGQFDNEESDSTDGLNKIHLIHSAANEYENCKNIVNNKISTAEATKIQGRTVDANIKVPLTVKTIKDEENISETVDERNIFNQKNSMSVDNFISSPTSSIISETTKDCNSGQLGLDSLPFNMDIFEDIPKCDDFANSIDDLEEDVKLFTEDNFLENLDSSGICLHVNSDKVSLEFCSICHLNSANSKTH